MFKLIDDVAETHFKAGWKSSAAGNVIQIKRDTVSFLHMVTPDSQAGTWSGHKQTFTAPCEINGAGWRVEVPDSLPHTADHSVFKWEGVTSWKFTEDV